MFQDHFDFNDQCHGQISRTRPRSYVINTWFKFEGKIPNESKVTAFTRMTQVTTQTTEKTVSLPHSDGGGRQT